MTKFVTFIVSQLIGNSIRISLPVIRIRITFFPSTNLLALELALLDYPSLQHSRTTVRVCDFAANSNNNNSLVVRTRTDFHKMFYNAYIN